MKGAARRVKEVLPRSKTALVNQDTPRQILLRRSIDSIYSERMVLIYRDLPAGNLRVVELV
jgi:hypothetical protein